MIGGGRSPSAGGARGLAAWIVSALPIPAGALVLAFGLPAAERAGSTAAELRLAQSEAALREEASAAPAKLASWLEAATSGRDAEVPFYPESDWIGASAAELPDGALVARTGEDIHWPPAGGGPPRRVPLGIVLRELFPGVAGGRFQRRNPGPESPAAATLAVIHPPVELELTPFEEQAVRRGGRAFMMQRLLAYVGLATALMALGAILLVLRSRPRKKNP